MISSLLPMLLLGPAAMQAGVDGLFDNLTAPAAALTQSTRDVLISLPLAALLGAALAFRPRRRGTPERSPPVIHTQIILAVVGAVVMLVVGASLARAFGIVGAASLIRYRAKIDDPKDAGVMLSCLAVGLASGVGLYALAVLSTLFMLALLWLVESLQPEHCRRFLLKVAAPDPEALRPEIEAVLGENRLRFDLRSVSSAALAYEVQVPLVQRMDVLSDAILLLDRASGATVEWQHSESPKRDRE